MNAEAGMKSDTSLGNNIILYCKYFANNAVEDFCAIARMGSVEIFGVAESNYLH